MQLIGSVTKDKEKTLLIEIKKKLSAMRDDFYNVSKKCQKLNVMRDDFNNLPENVRTKAQKVYTFT